MLTPLDCHHEGKRLRMHLHDLLKWDEGIIFLALFVSQLYTFIRFSVAGCKGPENYLYGIVYAKKFEVVKKAAHFADTTLNIFR